MSRKITTFSTAVAKIAEGKFVVVAYPEGKDSFATEEEANKLRDAVIDASRRARPVAEFLNDFERAVHELGTDEAVAAMGRGFEMAKAKGGGGGMRELDCRVSLSRKSLQKTPKRPVAQWIEQRFSEPAARPNQIAALKLDHSRTNTVWPREVPANKAL